MYGRSRRYTHRAYRSRRASSRPHSFARGHFRRASRRVRSARRARRVASQPSVVRLKHKLICSVAEFIALPQRDFWRNMACLMSANGKWATPNGAMNLADTILENNYLRFLSSDCANDVFPSTVDPVFNAWNPYLDRDIMSSLFSRYKEMYKYWRYDGVKVKWVPSNRSSTAILNPGSVTSSTTNVGASFGSMTPSGTGGYVTTVPQTVTSSTLGSFQDSFLNSPTLNMHVLFTKTGYENVDIPTVVDSLDADKVCKDTRFKFIHFWSGPDKPSNYKVYNMTKPFKFYVKPYIDDGVNEINEQVDAQTGTTNLKNSKAEELITSKKRLPFTVYRDSYPPEALAIPKISDGPAMAANWVQVLQNKNYLDPILFGYFFTVNGLNPNERAQYLRPSVPSDIAGARLDSAMIQASPFLSAQGHFQLTFYTTWRELKKSYQLD